MRRAAEVFTANCAVCHTFNREGGKGPDLTGVGSRDRADILLEILDPNRSVEANYRSWNVTTKDGRRFGRLEAETQTTVEILTRPRRSTSFNGRIRDPGRVSSSCRRVSSRWRRMT